jgi:osmotically-inducible protein OsmY
LKRANIAPEGSSIVSNNKPNLRADILAELAFEPSVDATTIAVIEADGVCTLSGHVTSIAEKHAAEAAVRRVKGLRAFVDQIDVKLPSAARHDPQEIARRASNVIDWNVVLPRDAIQVEVENDWVTLTGSVDWQYQKRAAEDGIRGLAGVAGISNRITIAHHVAASDVRERIAEAYRRSAEFDASTISIAVEGGVVTLSGEVRGWNERRSAENAIWKIAGVTDVIDRLSVAVGG